MDSYDEYFQRICRVCLSHSSDGRMVSLTNVDELSYYGKAIEKFANISINLYEELPQVICQNCLVMLKQAIKLKLKCESSDKRLLYLFRQHKETNSNLKELVVDFTLFSETFPNEASANSSEDNAKNACKKNVEENDSNNDLPSGQNEPNFPIERTKQNDVIDDFLDKLEEVIQNEPNVPTEINEPSDGIDDYLDQLETAVHNYSFKPASDLSSDRKRYKYMPKRRYTQRMAMQRMNPRMQIKHIKAKRVPKKHICEICQKVLANPATYKHHMQRHNGFDYICEHCGKGFPALDQLEMHLLTVHGTGPGLQCPHCPYKAPKKHVLTEHIRLHTGERPYTCEKCGLTFRRRALWVKHVSYHNEKTVQCPNCPRKFHNIHYMKVHFNNIHERMFMYMCRECHVTYAKSSTLRKHMTEKHGIPREMQGKVLRVRKGKDVGFPEQ